MKTILAIILSIHFVAGLKILYTEISKNLLVEQIDYPIVWFLIFVNTISLCLIMKLTKTQKK